MTGGEEAEEASKTGPAPARWHPQQPWGLPPPPITAPPHPPHRLGPVRVEFEEVPVDQVSQLARHLHAWHLVRGVFRAERRGRGGLVQADAGGAARGHARRAVRPGQGAGRGRRLQCGAARRLPRPAPVGPPPTMTTCSRRLYSSSGRPGGWTVAGTGGRRGRAGGLRCGAGRGGRLLIEWGLARPRPGRRAAGLPGRRAAGLPGRRAAGLPGRRAAGLPGRCAAGLPGRPAARPHQARPPPRCSQSAACGWPGGGGRWRAGGWAGPGVSLAGVRDQLSSCARPRAVRCGFLPCVFHLPRKAPQLCVPQVHLLLPLPPTSACRRSRRKWVCCSTPGMPKVEPWRGRVGYGGCRASGGAPRRGGTPAWHALPWPLAQPQPQPARPGNPFQVGALTCDPVQTASLSYPTKKRMPSSDAASTSLRSG
jgi:hypothetical protein